MADINHTEGDKHEKRGAQLSRMLEEGKGKVPKSPEPLVCKPRELEPWRVFKIMSEFVEGFELLQKYSLGATFFGSTRMSLPTEMYDAASELAGRLAKRGFAIITGGAQGIMEAANKGAYEAGGASVGLNIHLSDNQPMNGYVTDRMFFNHFFVRKVMLAYASNVYIYFPGGFGTLDEFFELVTLVQTQAIQKVPILVYGKEYWDPIMRHFKDELLEHHHTISEEDLNIIKVVDSVDEAYDYIVKNVKC